MKPRRTMLAMLAPLCLCLARGAGAFDLPSLGAPDVRAAQPAEPRQPAPPLPAEWTAMVFINSKNNLEEFGLKDLNEMETAGSTGKVNIVAELGRIKGYYSGDGDWTGVRRYLVRKDADLNRVASPVLAGQVEAGRLNGTGKYHNLEESHHYNKGLKGPAGGGK